MMYSRLLIARQLLKEDGVIFISIDDNEVHHLRKICDEVFGEENFIATFIWEKRTNRENRKMVSIRHDYVVCYCKALDLKDKVINQLPMNEKALSNYKNLDDDPKGLWKSDPASAQAGHGTKSQFYELISPNGKTHKLQSGRCWVYTKEVMQRAIIIGEIWFGKNGNGVPRIKTYLNSKERGLVPENILFANDVSTNEGAKNSLKNLFDDVAVFDTPKPNKLIETLFMMCCSGDDLILDFFSGSGVTGHSIYDLNINNKSNCKYILVQLPEQNNEKSEAYKAGY